MYQYVHGLCKPQSKSYRVSHFQTHSRIVGVIRHNQLGFRFWFGRSRDIQHPGDDVVRDYGFGRRIADFHVLHAFVVVHELVLSEDQGPANLHSIVGDGDSMVTHNIGGGGGGGGGIVTNLGDQK